MSFVQPHQNAIVADFDYIAPRYKNVFSVFEKPSVVWNHKPRNFASLARYNHIGYFPHSLAVYGVDYFFTSEFAESYIHFYRTFI